MEFDQYLVICVSLPCQKQYLSQWHWAQALVVLFCVFLSPAEKLIKHVINPLPLIFNSLLPGQEDYVFFSGHLNLHAKPETGIPYRGNNYNN
jgi:hypothetical protein